MSSSIYPMRYAYLCRTAVTSNVRLIHDTVGIVAAKYLYILQVVVPGLSVCGSLNICKHTHDQKEIPNATFHQNNKNS